jgi:hypothetical protein
MTIILTTPFPDVPWDEQLVAARTPHWFPFLSTTTIVGKVKWKSLYISSTPISIKIESKKSNSIFRLSFFET